MNAIDRFYMTMIVLCLSGAFVVGSWEYERDISGLTRDANSLLPGCAKGKYTCEVRYANGKPLVTMNRKAAR